MKFKAGIPGFIVLSGGLGDKPGEAEWLGHTPSLKGLFWSFQTLQRYNVSNQNLTNAHFAQYFVGAKSCDRARPVRSSNLRRVSSVVEQTIRNRQVWGSNPQPGSSLVIRTGNDGEQRHPEWGANRALLAVGAEALPKRSVVAGTLEAPVNFEKSLFFPVPFFLLLHRYRWIHPYGF